MRTGLRVRQVANWVNLSTPLGLLAAAVGRARVTRGHDGLLLAHGYRLRVPSAPAFTVGNVVLIRIDDDALARRPRLLVHEARHATQYAWCVGLVMLPLYGLAAAWSWLRCRNPATYNVFERLAGLADGGYRLPMGERHDQGHV
ncbi:MAG TPA: hypothetical protein VEX89_04985 [Actinomycetes bacterium]|nr:hypothetical protein [Actinomycetes bacterium]